MGLGYVHDIAQLSDVCAEDGNMAGRLEGIQAGASPSFLQ
jgi:hypothetical protein